MTFEIVQIITDLLQPYLTTDNVYTYPSNSTIKYIVNLPNYLLKIQYNFIDNFYSVRLEENKDNRIGEIIFLSKSKDFQKVLKKTLRKKGFSKKVFKYHIACLSEIVREQLDTYGHLDSFKTAYISNLKFDGIFL